MTAPLHGSDAGAFLALNAGIPPFNNVLARQAVWDVIDRAGVSNVWAPGNPVTTNLFPHVVAVLQQGLELAGGRHACDQGKGTSDFQSAGGSRNSGQLYDCVACIGGSFGPGLHPVRVRRNAKQSTVNIRVRYADPVHYGPRLTATFRCCRRPCTTPPPSLGCSSGSRLAAR